jgi:hypothetical protein
MRGGQVIGQTSADGAKIEERPVTAPELWATVCRLSGVDHSKRHKSNQGVMVSIVEANTQPIKEVLSPKNQLIVELIHRLDSQDFRTREQATEELEKFGAGALPALRRTATGKFSLEMTKRAQSLIKRIENSEAQLAEVMEKRWAALGREKHSIKIRIGKILQENPNLDDRQVVAALYLLTVARTPRGQEIAQAEERLRKGCYHSRVFFDVAWELVHSREFNGDLAGINARFLDMHKELNKGLAERLKLVNGKQVQELVREGAGKLARTARTSRELADMAFLVSLSRFPTGAESDEIERYIQGSIKADGQTKVADILGALINGREFIVSGER